MKRREASTHGEPGLLLKTVRDCLAWAETKLQTAEITPSRHEVRALLAHVLKISQARMLSDPGQILRRPQILQFKKMVRARCGRTPLQYILGYEEFMGMHLKVGPGVLIPRPETELLVEEGLRQSQERRMQWIADLGTGSGSLALALARRFPEATVFGVDRSPAALRWARVNRRQQGLTRVRLLLGDADTPIPKRLRGRFDLVVSNPPYIPDADMPGLQPEVRREPRLALVGGPDGLDGLRRMIAAAVRLLRTDGFFVCELGIGQARQAEIIFKQHGFSEIRVREDWQKIPRVISGRKIP